MSAMILDPARRPGRAPGMVGALCRLRRWSRAPVIAWSGFAALLAWAFFGSLVMGLRGAPTATPNAAQLWLAGCAAIMGVVFAVALTAGE